MAYRHKEPVSSLVDDLSSSFELASQLYAQWKSRRERSNHYRKPGSTTLKTLVMANCALTTSLNLGARTKETYSVGAAILGSSYAHGDNAARRALAAQRDLLLDQVAVLRGAITSTAGPLDISVILQSSETARIAAIQALVDQYRRMAMGRPDLPHELPTPKWRSPSRASREEPGRRGSREERPGDKRFFSPVAADTVAAAPSPAPIPAPVPVAPVAPSARWLTYLEDDNRTTAWSVLSGPLVFQSEPPSPPLTPKELALLPPPVPPLPEAFKPSAARITSLDNGPRRAAAVAAAAADLESAYGGGGGGGGGGPLSSVSAKTGQSQFRPKNSVFHIFCPEAMALQVDVRRPVPSARKCRCGFRWDGAAGAATSARSGNGSGSGNGLAVLQLKEGFGMSRRFLAKSHCEGDGTTTSTATGNGGYGCVLCTSSGLAQTYETAEDLRTHINATHDKWQMLHDRDLA